MRELQRRYQRGRIPFTACRADPRFSYCLYVPSNHQNQVQTDAPLLVAVHGSGRTAEGFRDAYIEFAEAHGCVVLAPLFPRGAVCDDDPDGYKLQSPRGYRYDQVLLSIIEEVATEYRTEREFYLYGFSGGAQFAHRFAYLHPRRLKAVSIHAPGQICLPHVFEVSDLKALEQIRVQMAVGCEDSHRLPEEVGEGAGCCRRTLLLNLHKVWEQAGIRAELEEVPGVAHDGFALMPVVQKFFAKLLEQDKLKNL
ncbi:PHB depolymerase family esterase [Marinobacterium sp. BA1]|uniref:PHB depolymerase family esterase n=1 Tax=Marinobacterium sp. BA1 TaxID=3138931 RepID=UPI0032E6496D